MHMCDSYILRILGVYLLGTYLNLGINQNRGI